jgi:hypothetical protein
MFNSTRFTLSKYGLRYWAVFEGETLICITLYRRGGLEVIRRLEELTCQLRQLTAASEDSRTLLSLKSISTNNSAA